MSSEARFYLTKPSGSDRARVYDRQGDRLMQTYNIFKNYRGVDGYTAAKNYCERLNATARAAAAVKDQA